MVKPFQRILLFILLLTLARCGAFPGSRNSAEQTPFFRPPTSAVGLPTVSLTLVPTAALLTPALSVETAPETATPACEDNLTFLQDLSIPDGTVVSPEATLDKRWQIQNSGNCNWDERYRVRRIAGATLGAAEEQALFPARSGSQTSLRMVFKAPAEPGSYRSAWQAISPQGAPFGEPFFIDIVVANAENAGATTATPAP